MRESPLGPRMGLALLCCFLPTAAVADAPDATWSPASTECETVRSWSSRHQALTPTSRQDCVHVFADASYEMHVSHQRRGLPDSDFLQDGFASALRPRVAAVDETESGLELAGSWSLWSYEVDFDLGREARIDGGNLLPENRSRLELQSGLDLGWVRSRVQLEGTQREEEQLFGRGLPVDTGRSTSELGARAFVDLTLPHLPVLTLGVGREDKEVIRGRRETGEQVESDVTSAAIWYGRSSWQAYAVSSRHVFRDGLRRDAPDGVYYDHYVSGSWWPSAGWTVNPGLQYSEGSWDGRETWSRTLRGFLGVYASGLWRNGLLTLWGGYTRDRDSARTYAYEQLDFAVGAEHTVGELSLLGAYELSVGANVGYSHYLDRIHPDASSPGYRGILTLRISGL